MVVIGIIDIPVENNIQNLYNPKMSPRNWKSVEGRLKRPSTHRVFVRNDFYIWLLSQNSKYFENQIHTGW